MCDRDEFERWISEFLEIDPEKLKRCRGMDNEGLDGYEGLEQEGCSDDADDMATLALQSWQAARVQGGDAPTDNDIPELDELCEQYNSGQIDLTALVCRVWNTAHTGSQGGEAAAEIVNKPWPKGVVPVPKSGRWYAVRLLDDDGDLPHGTKLYTHPSASVPEEWREKVEKAARLAAVFDDGGDGADDESARGVVAILNDLLTTTPQPADDACKWAEDEGMWNSECGYGLWYEDGTPSECGQKYCPKCGKRCLEVPSPPAEGAE